MRINLSLRVSHPIDDCGVQVRKNERPALILNGGAVVDDDWRLAKNEQIVVDRDAIKRGNKSKIKLISVTEMK